MRLKLFLGIVILSVLFFHPAHAQTVTELQAQIAVLQAQIIQLTTQLTELIRLAGGSTGTSGAGLTRNLARGDADATTGGEVSKLQRFLAQDASVYPEGRVSGFFGELTELAVKRWQAKKGIISSGSPETTGYGRVGPRTREAMNASGGITPVSNATTTGSPLVMNLPANIVVVRPPAGTGEATSSLVLMASSTAYFNKTATFSAGILPQGIVLSLPSFCTLPCTLSFSVKASTTTPGGSYTTKIRAVSGDYAVEGMLRISVLEAPLVFSVHPMRVSSTRPYVGSSTATSSIALSFVRGSAQSVSIAQSGFPSGVTATSSGCVPSCTTMNTLTIGAGAPTGTFPIFVTATGGGYTATGTYQLFIDEPEPEQFEFNLTASRNVIVTRPASGLVVASNSISASWIQGPPEQTSFLQEGFPEGVTATVLAPCTPTCMRDNYISVRSSAATGTYEIAVTAEATSTSAQTSYLLTIRAPNDSAPPSVTLTSSATGTVLVGRSVTLTANATDDVRVMRVEFRNGGSLVSTDTTAPYTYTFAAATSSVGTNVWTATAYDSSNFSTVSSPVIVVIATSTATSTGSSTSTDTTLPTVAITSPASGAVVSGSALTISASASDNVGVARVEFSVEGNVVATDSTLPYTTSWDTRSVPNGSRTVTATAFDAAGNFRSISRTITVSNTTTTATSSATGLRAEALPLPTGYSWTSPALTTVIDVFSGGTMTGYRATGTASVASFEDYASELFINFYNDYDERFSNAGWFYYYSDGDFTNGFWSYISPLSKRAVFTVLGPNEETNCPCTVRFTVFTEN